MNRENFCSTPQYKKWRTELTELKYILRNLDKGNKEAILDCERKINKLRDLMQIE